MQAKIEFISRKVNVLPIHHKEHVCKILITHDIPLHQHNNGAYCWIRDMSDEIIDIVYEYVVTQLK